MEQIAKITTMQGDKMIKQKQAETAWVALYNIETARYCSEDTMNCYLCPEPEKAQSACSVERADFLENWLYINGFPAREPKIHTLDELAKQLIKGRKLPCLTQWIAQYVEAVTCPGCGKHTLHREQRMTCAACNGIYPADKWAAGEPCECGSMDARYFGTHSENQLGQQFQRCQTEGCHLNNRYSSLTVQELADAAQVWADEQWQTARTCPACEEASGDDQQNGVYLTIESCECGWRK